MKSRGQHLRPERRSGIRILTLKNAGWLALSLTVLFLIFSAYMERRSRGESSYGRLFDQRIEATRPASPPAQPEVVVEAPERQAVRHDVLQDRRDEDANGLTTSAETATAAAPAARPNARRRRAGERVVISGGAEGVRVDVQPAPPTATAPPP